MRLPGPPEDADTPRDALLEAAFAQFVQQAQARPDFAAQVCARAARLPAERRPQSWPRQIVTWLLRAGGRWGGSDADVQTESWWARPRPVRGWTVVLTACLLLSLLGNIWLGVQRSGQDRGKAPTAEAPPSSSWIAPRPYGRIRLAFAEDAREQELRTLLLSLRATILAGPSAQGIYTVQVPLAGLLPWVRERAQDRLSKMTQPVWEGSRKNIRIQQVRDRTSGTPNAAEAMHLLLEELRIHPAVRLAEPVSPP